MKQAPDRLIELLEPVIEGLGYECVGIEFNPHLRHGLLRIYIDSPAGIVLDDCTKVSHQISGVLDVENPLPGDYRLEISSPGMDRPLFKPEQFQRFIGKTVKVQLYVPIDRRKRITGIIQGVERESVRLAEGEYSHLVPFTAISKARLVPEYLLEKGEHNGK
jgi:ribosome maturation factor RimP